MIDLHDAAEVMNDYPVIAPSPVTAILGRAHEIRRRTRLRRGVAAMAVVILGVGVVTTEVSGSPSQTRIATVPTPSTVPRKSGGGGKVPPPPPKAPLVAPPTELVAHLRDQTAKPGQIVVMNTATGAVTKILGADYDPYVGDGFQIAAGGHSVFWTHLNEKAQQFPVAEVPLGGGASRTVANGADDLPSPDGKLLLVSSNVVDLATLTTRPLPSPALDGQVFASFSWLPDAHTIVGLSVTPAQQCPGAPGFTIPCPTTTTTPGEARTRVWTIDTSTPKAKWVAVPTSDDWKGITLLGPGRLPGTVAADQWSLTGAVAIVTMRLDGTVVDRVPTPGGEVQVLAVDHSGTNFLIDDAGGLARISLADPTPVHIGVAVAEASWW